MTRLDYRNPTQKVGGEPLYRPPPPRYAPPPRKRSGPDDAFRRKMMIVLVLALIAALALCLIPSNESRIPENATGGKVDTLFPYGPR